MLYHRQVQAQVQAQERADTNMTKFLANRNYNFLNANHATNTPAKHLQYESTVSPGKRDLIFQRTFDKLDPIFRYCRYGADEDLTKIVYEPIERPNCPSTEGNTFLPDFAGGNFNALTAEPPNSVNIWWGYGEWQGIENQQHIWDESLPTVSTEQKRKWTNSTNAEGSLYPILGRNSSPIDQTTLSFRSTFPEPFGSSNDFYMASALADLAENSTLSEEDVANLVPDSRLEAVPYAEVRMELSLDNLPSISEVRTAVQLFLQTCNIINETVRDQRNSGVTPERTDRIRNAMNTLEDIQESLLRLGATQGQIDNTRRYFYFDLFSGGEYSGEGRNRRRTRGNRIPLSEARPENIITSPNWLRVVPGGPRGDSTPRSWVGPLSPDYVPQVTDRVDPNLTPAQVNGRDIPRRHTLGYFVRSEYEVMVTGQGYSESIFHEDRGVFIRNQELRRRFANNQEVLSTRNTLELSGPVGAALRAIGFPEQAFIRAAENIDESWGVRTVMRRTRGEFAGQGGGIGFGQEEVDANADNEVAVAPDKNALDVLNFIFSPEGLNRQEEPTEGITRAAFRLVFERPGLGTRIQASMESNAYVEFQFYDFKSETSFVRDPVSNDVAVSAGAQGAGFDDSILAGAFIRPEYNYFNQRYEQAIADSSVSEIILPNLYIYSLAAASPDLGLESPRWDQSVESRQIQQDYDRLITFGEFNADILPNLESGDQEYLNEYSAALEGKNFSLALTTPELGEEEGQKTLLEKYYNVDTPANEIELYDNINAQKLNFPMYVELGVPTIKIGPNVSLIQNLIPTDQVTHSILTTDPQEQQDFNCATTIVVKDNDEQTPLLQSLASENQVLNVYDFEEWIANCRQKATQGDGNGHGSLTLLRAGRRNFQQGNDALLLGLRTAILQNAKRKIIPYQNLLLGLQRNTNTLDDPNDPVRLADSETLMYKLIKKDSEGTIIQNLFFPNTDQDFINYVDTQVKYDKEYRYDLHAYDVVFGTKYRFRHRESLLDLTGNDEDGFSGAYASFNVEPLPCIKIVEYKVNAESWLSEALNPPVGAQGEPDPQIGGIFYPRVKVQDFPPTPPEVNLLPYRGVNDKVGIMLTPTVVDKTKNKAVRYYALNDMEERLLYEKNLFQKNTRNFNLKQRHLEFRGEGDEVKMEIYRLDSLPAISSLDDFYKAFGSSGPYRVLSLSPENLNEESVVSFDVLDNVEPNITYYYMFRSVDRHNAFSNPSLVYSVQLVSRDDFTYPQIGVYKPEFKSPKKDSKKMTRYVEISAADLQTQPFEDIFIQGSEPIEPVRSLVTGIEQESFLIRFTSRDTGRKFDVRVSFNVAEKTITVT